MTESIKFKILSEDQGQISSLELGGTLVLENAQQLKNKLVGITDRLGNQVKITVSELEEIDLSCIQILVAFIRILKESGIRCQFDWNIDEDQKLLLNHVGMSDELLMKI